MAVTDAVAMIMAATPPDLWTRRVGFALMFSELLFEDERQILAGAIHDMEIGADDLQVIEAAFRRIVGLVLGVRP